MKFHTDTELQYLSRLIVALLLLILTEEFAVDLGSPLRQGTLTAPCLWPLTGVYQLQINQAEVRSCFLRVQLYPVLRCVVRAVH